MSDQLALFQAPELPPGYDHLWRWGRPRRGAPPYDPQRKGRRCRVLCRGRGGGPRNVAVMLNDGELVCVPRYAVALTRIDSNASEPGKVPRLRQDGETAAGGNLGRANGNLQMGVDDEHHN